MIPLTTRSHYSMMWGTASPEELVKTAKRCGYNQLALTDTDNLYGLWPFLHACKREGITPIVGCELTDPTTFERAICLVENETGYSNLCRLITERHCNDAFSLKDSLPNLSSGLQVLTQSEPLLRHLRESDVSISAALPRMPTGIGLSLRLLAKELGISSVATPGSFFTKPEDYNVHRLQRAIALNTSLSRLTPKDVAPDNAWLAPSMDYIRRFDVWPDAIRQSYKLAERLEFTGPEFGLVLPSWNKQTEAESSLELRTVAYEGARTRYGSNISDAVIHRLDYELTAIRDKGFSAYFLIVQDIVKHSPRICGRGSGAASIVAYCMGITNVCPLKYNLYFERFLNPGRKDAPDIDVDFAWDERDAVQLAVLEKYKGHAAMVCNHVMIQPRSAIREVAKVYGLTDREIGQVSKRLPWFWNMMDGEDEDALLTRLKSLPQLKELDFPEPWPDIIRLAQRLIGTPRNLSVHSGGVVITPRPITDYVPIEIAPKGVPIVQWEKDGTEDSGLLKIDLLGNRSLGVIRDAIQTVKDSGQEFDETRWEPEDDRTTQSRVSNGETMGCFYIESPATRLLEKKSGVGDYEHMVIHTSIIRPAANKWINEYLARLKGEPWQAIHPLLEGVLDETYGIMVYQEHVSLAAVALAGFSHADADGLRKVMSRKDKARKLMDYFNRFANGARQNGVTDEQIEQVWDMILSFDGYSFCKPHSASYIRVSFQAAYLKSHYPAAFMAAVISNQGGFYSTFAYVSEARRMGVDIQPPDVNQSNSRWTASNNAIRVGLMSIKHLSTDTQSRIVTERQSSPYQNLKDFLNRVRPDEEEVRSMIHAGAFDGLHTETPRSALLWDVAVWKKRQGKPRKQVDLFSKREPESKPPTFPPENKTERLRREFTALGFLCDSHPMELFNKSLNKQGIIKAKELNLYAGKRVKMGGLLLTGKVVSTYKGDPMEFITFEDETGIIETTFFPRVYRKFCAILSRNYPYILMGKVDEQFGACTLTVDAVVAIR